MANKEIFQDAVESISMDSTIEFDEWYPAWMVDKNGNLINDKKRKSELMSIFKKAQKSVKL